MCFVTGYRHVTSDGLTLTWFSNTAIVGHGFDTVSADSLDSVQLCGTLQTLSIEVFFLKKTTTRAVTERTLLHTPGNDTCHRPHSALLSGRIAPKSPGNYGFNVSFTPALDYPSTTAYARLWVHDHLLYPMDTTGEYCDSWDHIGKHLLLVIMN